MTDLAKALHDFSPVAAAPIPVEEMRLRLDGLRRQMVQQGVDAVWLDATTSLRYFTGLSIGQSERLHGALLGADGVLRYISPAFECQTLAASIRIPAQIIPWDEDEDPCALVAGLVEGVFAVDPSTPFRFADGIARHLKGHLRSAHSLISPLRQCKSATEIAILQAAMDASYRVHKAVYAGLRPGIAAAEVADFITAAHVALGLKPLFAAVQFGEATAYPHGVPGEQILSPGDMVLVDMGGTLQGYGSDITRSYVFGPPSPRQRQLWSVEQRAQAAGFAAARLGATCASVDAAARQVITEAGFGPGYQLPGLPHRTGHGLGLDGHEEPYIVAGNETPLEPGMCFSIEPMLCVYGECGIRLEDIAYMTDAGPRWFTSPATSLDAPFGEV